MIETRIFYVTAGVALFTIYSGMLSGCATTPARIVTEQVKVEVPVPCKIAKPYKPDFPMDLATKEDNVFDKTKKALADIEVRKGYETNLETAIESCNK